MWRRLNLVFKWRGPFPLGCNILALPEILSAIRDKYMSHMAGFQDNSIVRECDEPIFLAGSRNHTETYHG